jgi:hypothetical protein
MLDIKESVKELEDNDRFQAWKEECQKAYLCHCMQTLNEDDALYIGYYNPEDDKITTFAISSLALSKESTDEVFKEPGKTVEKLNIDEVNVNSENAIEYAKKIAKENYPSDLPSKNILILQTINGKQVFNITFVTLAMSTINIKIDSKTKELVSHKKTSLMEFDASKEFEEK